MKRIEAIIRKTKFEEVKEALLQSDIDWFEYHNVHGIGQSRQERIYRGVQPRPAGGANGEGHSSCGAYGRNRRRPHLRERHDRYMVDSHRRERRHRTERQKVNK